MKNVSLRSGSSAYSNSSERSVGLIQSKVLVNLDNKERWSLVRAGVWGDMRLGEASELLSPDCPQMCLV